MSVVHQNVLECTMPTGTFYSRGGRCTLAECVHALKGLALPRARHPGEIALAAMSLAFHACGNAVLFAHVVVTVAKNRTSATPALSNGLPCFLRRHDAVTPGLECSGDHRCELAIRFSSFAVHNLSHFIGIFSLIQLFHRQLCKACLLSERSIALHRTSH